MNPKDFIDALIAFLSYTWPFLLFVFLRPALLQAWFSWRNTVYAISQPYILLELGIPREITKNPRAMEQVLLTLHSLKNAPGTFLEKWWDGEFPLSFSLEMISFSGIIHFYVYIPKKYKPLVQASFFSYYPDVEVEEVPNYVQTLLPENLADAYEQGLDIWGTEMMLKKDPIFPIKSFSAFQAIDEAQQYDPISGFMEVLGKIKPGETFGIQYLITPVEHDWYKPWVNKLEELKESKKKVASSAKLKFDFSGGPMPAIEVSKIEAKDEGMKFVIRTPGETDMLKSIEDNISKPAFATVIRVLYMGPKQDFYHKYARTGVLGIFNQYSGTDTNGFYRNFRVSTEAKFDIKPYVFPTQRSNHRKNRLLLNFKGRIGHPGTTYGKLITSYPYNFNVGGRSMILNSEALATLFHPPTSVVLTAPHIQRMASKKAGPPAGVAIFGHEREIEKYQ